VRIISNSRATAMFAAVVCTITVGASPASAQQFYELGTGWTFVASAPRSTTDLFSSGFDLRGSIGQALAPKVRLRFDADAMFFGLSEPLAEPCPSTGCPHSFYDVHTRGVLGFTANGLIDVDPRGLVYVIGGVGVYDTNARDNSLHVGGSAGAGIAIPLGPHYRAVIETTWHGLAPRGTGPSWVAPITLAVRF
jgi:hypothetical protein